MIIMSLKLSNFIRLSSGMFGVFCPCMHACVLGLAIEESCCAPMCGGVFGMRAYFRGKYNIEVRSTSV